MTDDPNITEYGVLRARNLEEIKLVCERHIRNIRMTYLDLIDNGDYTDTDGFYINMFIRAFNDLHEDVEKIIAEQNER